MVPIVCDQITGIIVLLSHAIVLGLKVLLLF
jgi:hypothetical protein